MCILGVAGFLWVKTRPASAMIRAETPGVYVSRGGAEWQVQGEILLRSGDRIRTEPKACAVIKYAREETRFELGGSTSLLFSQAHHGKGIWLGGGVCYGTVARQHFGQKFRFDTPQAQAEVLGTELRLAVTAATTELEVYEGVVLMRDASGKGQIRVEGGEAGFAGLEQALSKGPIPSATGHLRCQYWFEVAGGAIGDLTQDPRFPNQPDSRKQLDRCELGPETTTSFGAEISGWLHPPATGEYTFWITADDAGELWLSPNEQRETKRRICRTETYVTPEDWTKSPAQRSERIHLVAGRRYYLEALLKQAGGSAGLAVAWEGPAISREIIAGRYLSSPTE